jgi:hypothetical protein
MQPNITKCMHFYPIQSSLTAPVALEASDLLIDVQRHDRMNFPDRIAFRTGTPV